MRFPLAHMLRVSLPFSLKLPLPVTHLGHVRGLVAHVDFAGACVALVKDCSRVGRCRIHRLQSSPDSQLRWGTEAAQLPTENGNRPGTYVFRASGWRAAGRRPGPRRGWRGSRARAALHAAQLAGASRFAPRTSSVRHLSSPLTRGRRPITGTRPSQRRGRCGGDRP